MTWACLIHAKAQARTGTDTSRHAHHVIGRACAYAQGALGVPGRAFRVCNFCWACPCRAPCLGCQARCRPGRHGYQFKIYEQRHGNDLIGYTMVLCQLNCQAFNTLKHRRGIDSDKHSDNSSKSGGVLSESNESDLRFKENKSVKNALIWWRQNCENSKVVLRCWAVPPSFAEVEREFSMTEILLPRTVIV